MPAYNPHEHDIGIIHFGLGAFHKAHQAYYTDQALGTEGGNWKIAAVSLRNTALPEQLNAQNGLFTLITRSDNQSTARVIASIDHALSAKHSPNELMHLLCSPCVRIVTITITEKGYGIDRQSTGVDVNNPVIAADLKSPDKPAGLLGFLVRALQLRHQQSIAPFTVLSCDNLPLNGQFLRMGVLDFASRINSEFSQWIAQHVAFPSCMVDRITPAQTPDTLELTEKLTHTADLAAVETEPFHQWVIEDHFPSGRPAWEAAGALFTDDVHPFELMKLRMLNGAHSMMAYAGHLSGHRYIRDVMQDDTLVQLVKRHMLHSSMSINAPPGMDLTLYSEQLMNRFANTAIAHETLQIAMDGSQKMPQRIFEPAIEALRQGMSIRPFALATALWIRFCSGKSEEDVSYTVSDPLSKPLMAAVLKSDSPESMVNAFSALPGVVPEALSTNHKWQTQIVEILDALTDQGVRQTLENEVQYHLMSE